MNHEIKFLLIKLTILIAITPAIGFVLMRSIEYSEKIWKTGNRIKRWLVVCTFFFFLAVLGGFLQ